MAASISDIRLLLKVKSLPRSSHSRRVFITGGIGSIGSALIPILLERGHRVRVLAPLGSKANLPAESEVVSGNPLDASTYHQLIRPSDTFIHLAGIPHPTSPEATEPRSTVSGSNHLIFAREAINACAELRVQHFVYLSVAQPAPIRLMKDYIALHQQCEQMIRDRRLNSTILRPWNVLGPANRWPYLLLPVYKVGEWLPLTRAAALRLGPVTLDQLILALAEAVESPIQGTRIMAVPDIRSAKLALPLALTRKSA